MTEICQIKLRDFISSDSSLNHETEIFKGGDVVQETVRLKRHNGKCCSVQALSAWLNIRKNIKIKLNTLWLDIENKKEATPSFCSKQLTSFIRRARIEQSYTSPTIRHAPMTKLRANGATMADVNVLTFHSITSDVVDTFYYKAVEMDLGEIITKFEVIFSQNAKFQCEFEGNGFEMERPSVVNKKEACPKIKNIKYIFGVEIDIFQRKG
ncbi:MAG: hypothetical protein EZS28_012107 [Streblomastix strix]|uniref:Uncharacterized protein n=1 Tax=Streblomastix strix TaxID=222440 RepID=A0A5J4WCI3_9EUKA|nr:MAG: hypothetical protein EZS28_012107 [Streblomastix strix]